MEEAALWMWETKREEAAGSAQGGKKEVTVVVEQEAIGEAAGSMEAVWKEAASV